MSDKELVVKLPNKFKFASNWKTFAEAMDTYLGELKGSGQILLKYVIPQHATPVLKTIFRIR